jgi:hypothetical protein
MHKIKLDGDDDFYLIEHIPIEDSKLHPWYNYENSKYDFWVIKLRWATQLYKDEVIALHTNNSTIDFVLNANSNVDLVTMGFGTLEEDGGTPNIMKKVALKYITNDACTHTPYEYTSEEILDSMLCAVTDDVNTEKDACEASVLLS